MKKSLFLAAIATIALASCTQNEDFSQPEKISFNPVNYKAQSTKAPINTTTYSTTDPSFGVFAFWSKTTDWSQTADDDLKQYVGSNGSSVVISFDSQWKSENDYYWPLSGKLTFIGYTPYYYGNLLNNGPVTASYAKSTKTLSITGFSARYQDDLMYTVPETAQNLTANGTEYTGTTTSYKGVNIAFRHALSQIVFKAKAADGLAHDTQFKITKIEMKGIKDGADMNVVANGTPVWTAYADMTRKFDYVVYNDEDGVIVKTGVPSRVSNEIGTGFLMIPQTFSSNLTEDIDEFEVTYSMEGSNMQGVWTGPITKSVKIQPQLATVDAGTKYVFTLTISPDRILYSPSVSDWVSQYDSDSDGTPDKNYGSDYDVPEQD